MGSKSAQPSVEEIADALSERPRLDLAKLAQLRNEPTSYEPVVISKSKYADVVQGRNRFFIGAVGSLMLFMFLTSIPQMRVYGSLRHFYRKYCRGKILDLTPKIADERDVALYEMSKAVRVEFLVNQRVVDDGKYKVDESLPEKEQEERRKAMTLDFMTKNDHNWVGSEVTFAVVERAKLQQPDFQGYDTVIIRNELLNRKKADARAMLNSAAPYASESGNILVMDYGKSSVALIDKAIRTFNQYTESSMDLTHDYLRWIEEDGLYDIVECRRRVFGLHYALALRRKTKKKQ